MRPRYTAEQLEAMSAAQLDEAATVAGLATENVVIQTWPPDVKRKWILDRQKMDEEKCVFSGRSPGPCRRCGRSKHEHETYRQLIDEAAQERENAIGAGLTRPRRRGPGMSKKVARPKAVPLRAVVQRELSAALGDRMNPTKTERLDLIDGALADILTIQSEEAERPIDHAVLLLAATVKLLAEVVREIARES